MAIIFDDSYAEAWVTFAEDEKYRVRYLHPSVEDDLRETAKDSEDYERRVIDHVLRDWDGVYFSKEDAERGVTAECTTENKMRLIRHFPDRVLFLITKAMDPRTFGVPTADEIKKK